MLGRVLVALGLAAAAIAGGALAVARTDFVSNNLCAYAVATIEEASAAHVRVARCTVDPARLQLTIDGLEVGREGEPIHLTVSRVFAHVLVRPLQQRVRLEQLEVDHPALTVSPGRSGPSKKRGGECLPPVLENFELGRVTIRKASVVVRDPESGVLVEVPRLSASLHGEGQSLQIKLVARGGEFTQFPSGTGRWPAQRGSEGGEKPLRSATLLSARVAAKLDLRGSGTLEVTKADVIGTELSAFVSGKVEDLCDPRIDAAGNVRVDDLEEATGRLIPGLLAGVKGGVAVEVSFELAEGKPRLRGELRAKGLQLEGFSPGDLKTHFELTAQKVKLEKLALAVGAHGEIGGKAEIGLAETGLPLSADLTVRDLELAELLLKLGIPRSHVVLRVNGRAKVAGPLLPLALAGDVAFDLADFSILDRRFEQRAKAQRILEFARGRLATPVTVNPERVVITGAKLDVQGSRLLIDGTFHTDFAKGMDLAGRAQGFALEDFRGHLGPIPWKGKASLACTVRGPYTDPLIEAEAGIDGLHFLDLSLGNVASKITFNGMRLDLDEINAWKDRSRYGGKISLDFADDALPVIAHLDLPDAYLHDLIDLAVGLVPSLQPVNTQADVDGHLSGVIDVVGPVAGPDGTARMAFDAVNLWGQKFGDGEALFTLHGSEPRLQIERMQLRHGDALLELGGRFGPAWELEMDAHTENFTLADLDAASAAALQGPLTATTRVRGVASHPIIDTEVRFTGGTAGKARLGDGALALKVDGKLMTWKGTIGTHSLAGSGRLEGDFGYTSTLQLRFPDLSAYFQSFVPQAGLQSGAASADMTVGGSLLKWRESSGSVAVSLLKFTRGDLTFENDGPGQLLFGPQGLEIKRLGLRSDYLTFFIQGSRTPDAHLDVHTSAVIDGRLFATQVPDLEHASGTYSLTAAITGPQDAPSVLGNLRVENGELRLRGLPLALRELNGAVSFSQDALAIDQMDGRVNNGQVRITRGKIEMKALRPERLDIGLHLGDVTIKLQEGLTATLDGELALAGPVLEPTLSGNLVVSRMKYVEDLDLERSLLDFNRRPPAPKVLDRGQALLHYDLDLHLSRGVRIENNLARTDLKGDLKVTGTSRSMGLLGSVNTVRGTAQFRGNEFQIEQGALNFTDRQKIRFSYDFQAGAQVKDYKVKLHSFGTPADYKLLLTSEPALSDADIGFLLTFGFVSQNISQGSVSASDTAYALGIEALNKVTGFSEEVRRIIPKNAILRDPNIDFVTDYSAASTGGSRLEPMARFRSHLISEKLDVRVMSGLSTRRYRAVMAYQISDAVSGQVQVDNEHLNVATDLGVDLKLRWEGE